MKFIAKKGIVKKKKKKKKLKNKKGKIKAHKNPSIYLVMTPKRRIKERKKPTNHRHHGCPLNHCKCKRRSLIVS